MNLKELKPRKALNKAFLKIKPNRTEIEGFKTHLIALLDRTNDTESEEFHKNLVSDFLKDTYYKQNHFINTKGRNDLVIHTGPGAGSPVGVIIEAKKPTNKVEMLQRNNINKKAFQELVLYYLRERITHKNLEVKHLVVTNINEWFIFDATVFDRLFAQNKTLVQQFIDFEDGRLADTKTDFFYKQIAEPFIAGITGEVEFTYFDIRDYQNPLRNADKADDTVLIALFKLLSPEHLLKLPFANDSNSLDKRFYSELLHIIGLTETKEGGKKLIERNKPGERHTGSILEDAIIQLDSLDKLSRLEKPSRFGNTAEERLFNVALELCITWINRILFLKLLEAQLITYHKGDESYAFLNFHKIKNYDDLNSLFFQVLARKYDERNDDVKKAFEKVPYLNSSLFEPTDMEQLTLFISNLKDDKTIPLFSQTVLKTTQGKKSTGQMNTLRYLFEFLDAYDFGAEGGEEIRDDNKTLINASVLGLIFEKINGYKDGSFFTPGFITMYMCRETIRRAVVQKFKEAGYKISENAELPQSLTEIYNQIDDIKKANAIVNSIKICDPAVGSGHFLVSALNEMIAVKNDLKILQDRNGKRLKEYRVEVVNDELVTTDEDGKLYEYHPANSESQRIQETLFHEKQTIIENCLFGVDINPNSVKICRLRLWIELLKNSYYKNVTELETLPNIDINIKCGNSLVSRFAIDADLKQALKNSTWTIDSYRIAVDTYRNAESKEQKREMERLISMIKSNFRTEISKNDPKVKKLQKLEYEYTLLVAPNIFKENEEQYGSKDNKKKAKEREEKMLAEIQELKAEIEEIKSNKIFENAFEWRFEFPEVLNDEGDFVGFDVVIGNPPYGIQIDKLFQVFYTNQYPLTKYKTNLYVLFIERMLSLFEKGIVHFIIPKSLLFNSFYEAIRRELISKTELNEIYTITEKVFEDAEVGSSLLLQFTLSKNANTKNTIHLAEAKKIQNFMTGIGIIENRTSQEYFLNVTNSEISVVTSESKLILNKLLNLKKIKDCYNLKNGLNPGNVKHILISNSKENEFHKPIIWGKEISRYKISWGGSYINYDESLNNRINIKDVKTKDGMNKQNKVDFALRTKDAFENKKIVVRKTGDSLICCLDEQNYYFDTLVHGIYQKLENCKLEPLLAILNSKPATSFYRLLHDIKGKVFAKISLDNLGTFPIPELNTTNADKLSNLVNQILIQKNQNPSADTTDLENQIDQLVYRLYNLTEEEIKIVEEK